MAYLFNGSSQYISASTSPVTGSQQFSMACWFNSSSIDTNQGLINISSASGDQNFRLSAMGAVAGDPLRAQTLNGASNGIADSTVGYTANTWTHACATFGAGFNRRIYVNGGNVVLNSTSVTTPTIDRMFFGVTRNGSAFTNYTTGSIAFVGVWNVVLSAAEIQQLGRGVTPDLVRPQSLVFYAPLIRDLVDVRNGRALTNVNGTITDNPRIYS